MKVVRSTQFEKDYKLAQQQGRDISILDNIIRKLANRENLEGEYKIYRYGGWMRLFCALYIQPDWVLVYRTDEQKDELLLARTGDSSVT